MDWLDDLREGVVLVGRGVVTYLNAAAAELLHVDRDRVVGRPLIGVVRDHRIEAVARGGDPVEVEVRGRRIRVEPIRGGLSLVDVTRARQSEEDARELLAVLSHELRTPVTTIQSTIEALREDDLPAATRERFLRRAEQESRRLVRLLADLTVDVSPPRSRSVHLPEVVDRALALIAPKIAERGVTVRRTGPPLDVWMDPDKVLQLVVNLVENAVVHGPAGGEIVIETRSSAAGDVAEIEVIDRGDPLPEGAFEGLFVPHRRGDAAAASGAGLGLYIVRSIADRAGGRAWGRPTRNGNAFGVALPRPDAS